MTRAGRDDRLLPREFRLLEYLMRHAGHIVTRTMLLEKVWDHHFDPQTNVIDVHVSRLRQKIDKGFEHAAAAHRARRRLHAAPARLSATAHTSYAPSSAAAASSSLPKSWSDAKSWPPWSWPMSVGLLPRSALAVRIGCVIGRYRAPACRSNC